MNNNSIQYLLQRAARLEQIGHDGRARELVRKAFALMNKDSCILNSTKQGVTP